MNIAYFLSPLFELVVFFLHLARKGIASYVTPLCGFQGLCNILAMEI